MAYFGGINLFPGVEHNKMTDHWYWQKNPKIKYINVSWFYKNNNTALVFCFCSKDEKSKLLIEIWK